MILRFGVSNHLSMRDYQELSFTTSSLKDQCEGLIDCEVAPHGSVLPAVVIYGPNASGKSNFVAAIRAMQSMILWSQTRGEPGGDVLPHRPFKLNHESSDLPSRFDIDFVIDGVRHHYGFETSAKVFEAEWLYAFPKSHQRALFERRGDSFRFGRGLRGQNNNIAGLTRPNSLFLSAAAQNGHEYLSKVFRFFRSILHVGNISVPGAAASNQITRDGGIDPRVISFLETINTGVVGYRQNAVEHTEGFKTVRHELVTVLQKYTDSLDDMEKDDKHVILELAHRGQDGEEIFLDLGLESAGTRRLLIMLGLAFRALDRGWLVCADELDASLHTQASEAV
ncbi:MAG: ATP-binding protein, partial [Candidatus Tectomicrobia bacterium]|nr:ATP-binding protein [Candidatus Tectomicrobia bacterium]